MGNIVKALLVVIAAMSVIALGLFWPSEYQASDDGFVMKASSPKLSMLTTDETRTAVSDFTALQTVLSTTDDIRSGRFKYREEDVSWRFTVPIDWGKAPDGLEVRRVIQRVALADPFLKSFEVSDAVADFQQAAFFFLDWQNFHQTNRKITAHAWDDDAVKGRTGRLAFILNAAGQRKELLSESDTLRLMSLADFHVQRLVDPVYGAGHDSEIKAGALRTLCGVVGGLMSCQTLEGN